MSSGGKRRTSKRDSCKKNEPSTRRRRRRRPPDSAAPAPPPPPPEPLIALLKSDKVVFAYFQSLQTHLDADVKRWKDRAKHYKEKCEHLQARLSDTPNQAGTTEPDQSSRKSNLANDKPHKQSNGSVGTKISAKPVVTSPKAKSDFRTADSVHTEQETIPIDDRIFDLSEAESSDESLLQATNRTESSQPPPTYKALCNAYHSLEQLGVSLVTEVLQSEEAGKQTDPETNEGPTFIELEGIVDATAQVNAETTKGAVPSDRQSPRFLRRSDDEVLADFMHALRTLSRLQLLSKEAKAYGPFMTARMIPCWYSSDSKTLSEMSHPAIRGLACAFHALSTMHACAEDSWDSIFIQSRGENDDQIRIGTLNRRDLVARVVESIHGEISSAWGVADRSSRVITTALHFVSVETPDATEGHSSVVTASPDFGAKSHSRLASLSERCIHALLVSNLYHYWGDPQQAAKLVWNYILSTTPSLGVEKYPTMPPVLSICVVEALLSRDNELANLKRNDIPAIESSEKHTWFARFLNRISTPNGNRGLAVRALNLSINTAVQIWKERLASADDRITHISRVETMCHERLLSLESSWLKPTDKHSTMEGYREVAMSLVSEAVGLLFEEDKQEMLEDESDTSQEKQSKSIGRSHRLDATLALQLALTTIGDYGVIENVLTRALDSMTFTGPRRNGSVGQCIVAVSCCVALRQINIRQLDDFRGNTSIPPLDDQGTRPLFKADELVSILMDGQGDDAIDWEVVSSIAQCCFQLGSGEALFRLVWWLVAKSGQVRDGENVDVKDKPERVSASEPKTIVRRKSIALLLNAGQAPIVRVINLRRRPDRMTSFVAQAQHEQLLVVRGVAQLGIGNHDWSNQLEDMESGHYWGHHAFDGKGRASEVDARLSGEIGVGQQLNAFVETHWRPNDLKAFDKGAREDDSLVLLSSTERACALSHVASWKGVARSLSSPGLETFHRGAIFPHPENTLRLFRISGFASGPALLHENSSMPPKPVCVVVEDDAILVDRFVERLMSVLEELPRDFHFCSLGYSRPKTAPIAKYSSQLGIPSCLWYLTGYILSLDGANLLLDSLPVKGPVDSWIGLKMCSNWDNVYGHNIGVGFHSRPLADLPPRKDLVKILKFRAFCALSPLCSQKVGAASQTSTVGRTWRQRDTDIVFSGGS